ncbi:Helix-turn-helix domain-containing protein [Mesorhizobium albiziae]|uniref:Helix-turn-helix domain-containing protein n=1 Tax=Neomesorhizobium albiziae TaxID=335020 RepID=A0A1I3Y592_9HYPH|nr:helix-turn-helix domain-containing protein [Mesorhizobium albiziae]GLS30078.1 transcriptional regulator [Mesorhizobium albiziae]SFK27028.1 Helix-turn-helix domain-containing protein [Mesorhizobium albiziae]
MTPFGLKLRELRRAKGVSQKQMAASLGVSAAYLSALEHGRRGMPNWVMVQKMIGYFNIIWDEAEELERLAGASHPRVVVDTSGLSPRATELANLLSEGISQLREPDIDGLLQQLRAAIERSK